MSTTNNSTTTGPVPSIKDLREQFSAGMLTVAAANEQRVDDSLHNALATLREAFDHMSTLAARPQAESSEAGWLGPRLPSWELLNEASPLIEAHLPDTASLVATHLEGIAFALSSARDDDGCPSREAVHGLAWSVRIAIAALHAHTRAGRRAQA